MHERTNIQLRAADRNELESVAANRNSPQKHVWRAKIILLTDDGHGTAAIMRATGKVKTVIWRWQERFSEEGVAGLWRDKTRPSRIPPLSPETAERVVALTLAGPPPTASHWTGAAMAKAAGISVSSVQRIWRAHGLRPHLVRRFKLSNDPQFAAKLKEIVGLYVNPPNHAIVLSVDEKSQIQALDRTQPGLPMKKGRAGTITHDYKRHGLTTLFAALDVLEGKVIGQCMKRHRHREFIRFLNVIDARVAKKKTVCRSQASKVLEWIERREFLCETHQKAPQARRVSLPPGTQRCYPPLPRRYQCKPKALYLDQGPQQNHRRRQARAPNVRFDPLAFLRAGALDDKRKGHTALAGVADFLESVPSACPHELFTRDGDPKGRASQANPGFAHVSRLIVNGKENSATQTAALVIPAVGSNKLRHEALQRFMLANDSVTLAIEVPITQSNSRQRQVTLAPSPATSIFCRFATAPFTFLTTSLTPAPISRLRSLRFTRSLSPSASRG